MTAREFEDALESLVCRLSIDDAVLGFVRLHAGRSGSRPRILSMPHVAGRIVEAMCAYHRRGSGQRVDDDKVRKLHNLFGETTEDAVQNALLESGDLHQYLYFMHAVQIVPQFVPSVYDFARLGWLVDDLESNAPDFLEALSRRHGELRLANWIRAMASLSLMSHGSEPPVLEERDFRQICRDHVAADWILEHLCYTNAERGAEYRRRLSALDNPGRWAAVPTSFIQRPVVRLDSGLIAVPFPGLLAKAAFSQVVDLANAEGGRTRESLSGAISNYVNTVIASVPRVGSIVSERQLKEEVGEEKVCDLLVRSDDADVLLEIKSTTSRPEYPRIELFPRHGIGRDLRHAIGQLESTLRSAGRLLKAKHSYAAVVIPEEVIAIDDPHLARRLLGVSVDESESPLEIRGLDANVGVLSLRALDLTVNWLSQSRYGMVEFVRLRRAAGSAKYGGLETFASALNRRSGFRPGEWFKTWSDYLLNIPSERH